MGRRLQKQDTRPSGNPAPAFNNERPRLGSGRWHGAGPRDTRDPAEWLPRLCSAPCPPVPTGAASGIAWRTGRVMTAGRDEPFQHHGLTGPHRRPLRSQPRPGLPAPLPACSTPESCAMEGETRALTQSDSSRSWDINLVCHSAVSRRRPRALEQMAAVPRSGHSLGILLPRLPEQLGRAGGTQDTWPQLPPCPWGRGSLESCRCPLSRGWMMLSPPGSALLWILSMELLGWKPSGSLQPTLMSTRERKWIPGFVWMWNSHWPVWVYRGIKYIKSLTKICSKIWEGNLVWDGWNCAGLRLSVLSDI